jgi:hypothetical protein
MFFIVITGLDRIFPHVLRVLYLSALLGSVLVTAAAAEDPAPTLQGRVIKVLPQLLDKQGRSTVSPSLFDRDAYQAHLRTTPDEVSGIRYDVLWKAHGAVDRELTVRVELRGMFEDTVPRSKTLEFTIDGRKSIRRWSALKLTGKDYTAFGRITAWRATLWCDGKMLDEYKSFLW